MESPAVERLITISAKLGPAGPVTGCVRDNGSGIPEDQVGKLFVPFFTTKSTGMGIGLAMSKKLIEAHHGKLWAENSQEGGAELTKLWLEAGFSTDA